ncbi:MAG TPA: hypothetical protein VFL82_17285 [Thermomicrobiales bacterium]|nr:hypothetical protein [Thermomicrobiales bacterium]
MRTLDYFTRINSIHDPVRVRCVIDAGAVRQFTIQYEPWIEGKFRPVVRFDNAHGTPHRDVLDWDGNTITKDWDWEGVALDDGAAMNLALDELRRDWETYRADFIRRKP